MGLDFRTFSAKQRRLLAAPTGRYILLADGAVRSGKTIPATLRWLALLGELPRGAKALMTGKTLGSLRNNVLDDLFRIVGRKNYRYNRQDGMLTICGRRVRVVGAHDESSQDVIQGDTFAAWYADEVTLYPRNFADQAIARLSDEPGMVLWTCNPEGPFHWVHREFIDLDAKAVSEGLVRRVHFELDDNPSLSEAYKRTLKATFTGVFYQRNVLGLWVMAEGVIYDGFDLKTCGFDDGQAPRAFDHLEVAVDYGTQNPFHALLIGYKSGVAWVLAEWRYCGRDAGRQKTDGDYSADLRAWLAGRRVERVVVDPTATSFVAQLKRDRWVVKAGENDVVPGIRLVANLLARGRLRVHRTACPHLVKEMSTYAWDPKAAQAGEDRPLKQHDHACFVAGTQIETDAGRRPIEALRAGHLVHTRNGLRKVLAAGMTAAAAQVIRVSLSTGESLTGTPDHLVMAHGRGFVRLDALRYGDTLVTWPTIVEQQSRKKSSSTAYLSSDTQERTIGRTGPTTAHTPDISGPGSKLSIESYGRPGSGRSRQAGTFTTKTATHSIMIAIILNAYRRLTIAVNTFGRQQRQLSRILLRFARWPRTGTGVPMAENGTESMGAGHGRNESHSPGSALSAENSSIRSPIEKATGSARTHVNQRGVAHRESTTNPGSALSADLRSRSIATRDRRPVQDAAARVIGIEPAGIQPVFNLQVDDTPEFFASGALVHNCDALRYALYTRFGRPQPGVGLITQLRGEE